MVGQASAISELVTRRLELLDALGEAAQDLAERSKNPDLKPAERAALRNQARCANDAAGALLSRGAIDLFNKPPSDAAKKINDAITTTQSTLKDIEEVGKAIAFVGALVGLAAAILTGNWIAVGKGLSDLVSTAKNLDPSPKG
jgi:hypothetical protein